MKVSRGIAPFLMERNKLGEGAVLERRLGKGRKLRSRKWPNWIAAPILGQIKETDSITRGGPRDSLFYTQERSTSVLSNMHKKLL